GPDTAQNFVNQNEGCELVEDWDYQYRLSNSNSPEPTGYGELDGWETFTNTTDIELDGNTTIQVREVLPEGYIPFTGQNSQDNVSAEFYCHNDAANYDNWEWITNPQDGATYYCVAWNVQKPVTLSATKIVCDDEASLPNWATGQNGAPSAIDGNTATDFLAQNQNCHPQADWNFQWKAGHITNPEQN